MYVITNLQKWKLLAKDKAGVFLWILYKTFENVELFQALEDEASAKVEIRQKTKPYRKLLSFSQGADAELLRGHVLGGLIEIWFYVALWRCV